MMFLMMSLVKDQWKMIGAELIKFGDGNKRGRRKKVHEMEDVEEGCQWKERTDLSPHGNHDVGIMDLR